MLSLPKLIVLIAIILAVLYGFRLFSAGERRRAADNRREPPRAAQQKRRHIDAEDLVKCPECGAYITAGGQHDCRGRA